MSEINKFLKFNQTIFGKLANPRNVHSDDWVQILGIDRSDVDQIRMLFFPSESDYRQGILRGKYLEVDPIYFSKVGLPLLRPDFSYKGLKHSTRRPKFLSSLSHNEYTSVFKILNDNKTLPCPTW
jgi:hypothetical protein